MTSVPFGDVQATYAATLVDEWARGGIGHAVICPGSRSTPMAVALAAHPDIAVLVRLDERSAAFTALGMGLASGRPALLVTTSGTAAAELHAAVVEADLARVPLIVVTADRPPELHGYGAPQTIDQTHLYGRSVRWYCDPGVAGAPAKGTWRSLAARSVIESRQGPFGPGPVHLNLPFAEPLLGQAGNPEPGRPHGQPWHQLHAAPLTAPGDAVSKLVEAARRGKRGLLVVGAGCGPPGAVRAVAHALQWPVLADPRSGLRVEDPHVVATADLMVRAPSFAASVAPEMVVCLGQPWVSKALSQWLAGLADGGVETMAVDAGWQWVDPDRVVSHVVRADPGEVCRLATVTLDGEERESMATSAWMSMWQGLEGATRSVLELALNDAQELSEPSVSHHLFASLPANATLMVSSSMPIRDMETFALPRVNPPRVLSNRGANGIDGVMSTALGVAVAEAGNPVVALVGDLAFLHDVSALVRTHDSDTPCTIVVVDNGGGGIFSFLPQAQGLDTERFETLFGTPQSADVAAVATGFGLTVDDVGTVGEFTTALAQHLGNGEL